VQVVAGTLKENQRITAYALEHSDTTSSNIIGGSGRSEVSVQEVGILTPRLARTRALQAGQVGYVISGMRSTREARVGDTLVGR
jgi:translation elongation factor EF-4